MLLLGDATFIFCLVIMYHMRNYQVVKEKVDALQKYKAWTNRTYYWEEDSEL